MIVSIRNVAKAAAWLAAALVAQSGLPAVAAEADRPAERAFLVPAGSMMPALQVGDHLIADMTAYDARDPGRGDIVVLLRPDDGETIYLKRIVGLPGDRLQMIGGVLYINGEAVERERVANYVGPDPWGEDIDIPRYRETLPNGVAYETLDSEADGFLDDTPVHELPPGHYFLMGDNRDNSVDSRLPVSSGGLGDVPRANIIGQASFIYWSRDLTRIGTKLR